jgi:plastocyanin
MRSRSIPTAFLAAAALVLAACGGGDGGNGDTADNGGAGGDGITIVATEYEFDPSDVSIPADTAVEVTLENQGIIEHDWTVDELDVEIYTDAGDTNTVTVTAAAGTYDVYCSIPGHRELGMEGSLTVG